jgi:hypothetical protein
LEAFVYGPSGNGAYLTVLESDSVTACFRFHPALAICFSKQLILAERSRSPEISIDILLAALDAPEVDPASLFDGPAGLESGGYTANTKWKSLSAAAAKALAPFAERGTVDRDALRRALFEAPRE